MPVITPQYIRVTLWEGAKVIVLAFMVFVGIAIRLFGWLPAWNTQIRGVSYRANFLLKLGAGVLAAILGCLWLLLRTR